MRPSLLVQEPFGDGATSHSFLLQRGQAQTGRGQRRGSQCLDRSGWFPKEEFSFLRSHEHSFSRSEILYTPSPKLNFLLNALLSLSGQKRCCPSSEPACPGGSEPGPAPAWPAAPSAHRLPRRPLRPRPSSLTTGLAFPRQGAVIKSTVRSH